MKAFFSRKPVIIFSLLFLLVAANIGLYQLNRAQEQHITTEQQAHISVTYAVEVPEKEPQKARISAPADATALEVLERFYTTEKEGSGVNAFVTSINGYRADTEKKEFWAFYVNGEQAQVGAGTYKLQQDDTILWKIETYE